MGISIFSNTSTDISLIKKFGTKRLIFSAGMPRSGSTLLFNMLRLILHAKYKEKLSVGWIKDLEVLTENDIYLIKTHRLSRIRIWRAFRSFYTYRDIRVVLVSRFRKFEKEPSIDIARYYIRQYNVALKNGVPSFKYEDFIRNQLKTIETLTGILNIDIDPKLILQDLPDPRNKKKVIGIHDPVTFLHENHTTRTEVNEWKDVLSRELQDQLHSEFGWWFKNNGYSLPDKYLKQSDQ